MVKMSRVLLVDKDKYSVLAANVRTPAKMMTTAEVQENVCVTECVDSVVSIQVGSIHSLLGEAP